MMKDITEFDKKDLLTYLMTLASLAHCDGLHEKEIEFINIQSEIAGVPHEEIWSEQTTISDLDLRCLPALLKKLLIRDALALAYIDGEVSLEERNHMDEMTAVLGLTKDDSEIIENWLKSYWKILEQGKEIFS